jgi:ribonucleotide monophosphatase NagD (HAD superfamily)
MTPAASDSSALRLVATDLDGTLLHTDGTVTDRTRRALTAVEERGVVVVFVTGRPIRWMEDLGSTSAGTAWRSAPTAASCTTCTRVPW